MKKLFTFLFFGILLNIAAFTQGEINVNVEDDAPTSAWQTLGKITFKKQYDDLLGFKIDIPVFSDDVRAIDGEEITLRGYIVPTQGYKSHNEFVFSAFPYNMCFFCGGAGPETVIEVVTVEAIEYTADPITIKGKLALNDEDPNRLMYALSGATLLEE